MGAVVLHSVRILSLLLILKLVCLVCFVPCCAVLHKVAIDEIDNSSSKNRERFDFKVNEYGFNAGEAGRLAKGLSGRNKEVEQLETLIAITNWGPTTGNPVF